MKKFLASLVFVVVFAVYVAYQGSTNQATASNQAIVSSQSPSNALATNATGNTSGASAPPQSQTTTGSGSGASTNSQTASTQPSQQTAAATPPVQARTGQYKNGTYTGTPEDAYYGTVQVQVTVAGGKISNVAFLQYPNTHSTSVYINQQAMPLLKQEAISAQNAQINGVSGATDTSYAFQQSLVTALSQAKA